MVILRSFDLTQDKLRPRISRLKPQTDRGQYAIIGCLDNYLFSRIDFDRADEIHR